MKIYILLLFFVFLCASCKTSQKTAMGVKVQNIARLSLHYPPSFRETKMNKYTFFEKEDSTYFVLLDVPIDKSQKKIKIATYNLTSKRLVSLDSLDARLKKYKGVSAAEVIGNDSLLVEFFPSPAPHFRCDSTLVLLNLKGKIRKVYSVENMPVVTWKNPVNDSTTESIWLQRLPYQKGNIALTFCNTAQKKMKKNLPLFGVYNLYNESFNPINEVQLPAFVSPEKWALGYTHPHANLGLNNDIVVSWGYGSDIIQYSTEKKQLKNISLNPSSFLRNPHATRVDEKGYRLHSEDFEPDAGGYMYIVTDKYRNRYLRAVSLPPLYYGQNNLFPSPKTAIMLYDAKWKLLGEDIVDSYLPSEPFGVIKKGYIMLDYEKIRQNLDQNKITYDSLYLKIIGFDVIQKEQNIQKGGKLSQNIEGYLNANYPKALTDKRSVVVVSYIESTCKGCLKQLIQTLGNKTNIKNYPNVYLLLIFDRELQADDYLESSELNSPNILVEKGRKHNNFFYQGYNPKAYFFKQGKYHKETQLSPSNEQHVLEEIKKYVN